MLKEDAVCFVYSYEKLWNGDENCAYGTSILFPIIIVACFQEEDDAKHTDDIDMPGQKFDGTERQTVRNLRIREDTAKVLSTRKFK